MLSRVLAERGLNDQAPQRPQALEALEAGETSPCIAFFEALISAIKLRDGATAKEFRLFKDVSYQL